MNRYPVTYSHLFRYDAGKPGITVPVTLQLSHISVNAETKLDTGSSYCIFEVTCWCSASFDLLQFKSNVSCRACDGAATDEVASTISGCNVCVLKCFNHTLELV